MRDLILALLGKRWCDWCNDTNPWMWKLMGGEKYHGEYHHWWEKLYWGPWTRFSHKMPFWKIGWWWHSKRHTDPPTKHTLLYFLKVE